MNATGSNPTVSVVIPTVARPLLVCRAVRSALDQSAPPYEVVVVQDGDDVSDVAELQKIDDPRVKIVSTGRPSRDAGATARNLGISVAKGEWVALLDDDDEWLPAKLERQLAQVKALPQDENVVVSTVVERQTPDGSVLWPTRPISEGERVADYLFVRASPGEGWLPTPTLLVRRKVAAEIKFASGLKQHEDLDWLLRLEAGGARFVVVPEKLAIVHVGESESSLSRDAKWVDSLQWAQDRRKTLGDRAFSAFCLTEVSRAALKTPSLTAFLCIARASRTAHPRAIDILHFLVAWTVPRSMGQRVNRLRLWIAGKRRLSGRP